VAHFPTLENVELRKNLSSRVFNRERTPSNVITRPKGKSASEIGQVVTPQALAKYTCDLNSLSTNTANLLEPFVQQINEHCPKFTAEDMQKLWMPFLYRLIPALVSRSIQLNKPCYQQLARQFIKRSSDTTLGLCPNPDIINRRTPQVRCTCADCTQLNRFLQESSQRVCRFKATRSERYHLHQQIEGANIDCTHVTDRTGYCETLVVTKRRSLQDEINGWKKRQKGFYVEICSKIQPEHLETLLGHQEAANLRKLSGLDQ
jgi:hypothetical protein